MSNNINQQNLLPYPWLQTDWQKLTEYQQSQKIPHAIILTGKKGLAKRELASLWVKSLLCDSNSPEKNYSSTLFPCQNCDSCLLFDAKTHPDYLLIEPEEVAKVIKVDQIREVVNFVSLTRSRGQYRIILISPAENMNSNAANSLLKTLEEPAANTKLILTSSNIQQLPATIRSRCQLFPVTPPKSDELEQYLVESQQISADEMRIALSISENSPVDAEFYVNSSVTSLNNDLLNDWQSLADGSVNPSKIAEKWLKQSTNIPLKLVYTWIVDMIRYQSIRAQAADNNYHTGHFYQGNNKTLESLALKIPVKRLFSLYDKAVELIKLERSSLNKQIQLESLLIQWSLVAQSSK